MKQLKTSLHHSMTYFYSQKSLLHRQIFHILQEYKQKHSLFAQIIHRHICMFPQSMYAEHTSSCVVFNQYAKNIRTKQKEFKFSVGKLS